MRGAGGTAGRRFSLLVLERLAKAIADECAGEEIGGMLGEAGLGHVRSGGRAKWRLVYGRLARLHSNNDHGAIVRVLEAACRPRAGRGAVRRKVNECLKRRGLRFGEDGKRVLVGRVYVPDADRREFDQREHHRLVAEHAGPMFAKGAYRSAVGEACKALEGIVREKSKIDDSGAGLMGGALGKDGALAVDIPGLADKTTISMQGGLMHMCMGMMLGVRNPVSHEPEASLPVERTDALEILGAISYLCRQVDRTRRKARRAPPKRGAARGPRKSTGRGGEPAAGGIGEGRAKAADPADLHSQGSANRAMGKAPVESSSLSHVGYDEGLQTLRVWFHGGGAYEYYGVPRSEHDGLMSAASHSAYLHRHIRRAYAYRKVE